MSASDAFEVKEWDPVERGVNHPFDQILRSRLMSVDCSNVSYYVPIPGSIMVANDDDHAGQLWAQGRCGRDSARLPTA